MLITSLIALYLPQGSLNKIENAKKILKSLWKFFWISVTSEIICLSLRLLNKVENVVNIFEIFELFTR